MGSAPANVPARQLRGFGCIRATIMGAEARGKRVQYRAPLVPAIPKATKMLDATELSLLSRSNSVFARRLLLHRVVLNPLYG